MYKRIFSFILIACTFGIANTKCAKLTKTEAVTITKNFIEKGTSFLKKVSDTPSKKETQQFFEILDEFIDFEVVAQDTLGKVDWNKLNEEQRKNYVAALKDMIVNDYMKRFKEYAEKPLNVEKASPKPSADGIRMMVLSILKDGNRPPVRIEWEVRKNSAGKVVVTDLIIEGISMSSTKNREFRNIRRRGGFKGLMQFLHSRKAI